MKKLINMIAITSLTLLNTQFLLAQPAENNEGTAQSVTFRTAQEAPADFDMWTFFWNAPKVTKGTTLEMLVMEPDGKVQCKNDLSAAGLRRGCSIRSDHLECVPEGSNPKALYNKQIFVVIRAYNGRMSFSPSTKFSFAFYKKDASGEIVREPFKKMDAAFDLEAASAIDKPKENVSYSWETTFRTEESAPADFDKWTFFWNVPKVSKDADFDYVVLDPEGKVYFQYDLGEMSMGNGNRSDFSPGFAGGDPSVFFNKNITFKFRVTQGDIKFAKSQLPRLKFVFYKKGALIKEIKAVAEPQDKLLLLSLDNQ